jgi:hypothetical protein
VQSPHPLRSPAVFVGLALCLAIAILWLRSYLPETLLCESDGGRVLIIARPQQPRAVARTERDGRTVDGYLGYLLDPQLSPNVLPREHRLLGFYYARGDDEGRPGGPFQVVGVPYWFLFTAVAVPTVLLLRRHRVASRRRAAALCATCGYDCRATPDRCPECGTIPAR